MALIHKISYKNVKLHANPFKMKEEHEENIKTSETKRHNLINGAL